MRDTSPAPAHVVNSLQSRLGRSHIIRLLTALVLALMTWGWVVQATDPITTTSFTEVEMQVPSIENELVMVTTLPRGTITVEGPKSRMTGINRTMLGLTIDTSSVTEPGEYRLPVVIQAPESSVRISVEPKTVRVQVDELVSHVIPLEVQQQQDANTTRIITNVVPAVSQVTVDGPGSAVDRVEKVILPITIDTQTSSFTAAFVPYAIDANGQRVSEVNVRPQQIMTSVELQTRGRVVTVIPAIEGQPADGYIVQQRTVIPTSILVDGPEDVLKDLLFVNSESVNIDGASQSVSSRVGLADLPPGVSVVEPVSGQVEVRVAIQDSSATTQLLVDLPVNILNVADGYTATITPATVDVTVQGSVTNLASMRAEDITIIVDASGLGAGTHFVTPVAALPNIGVLSTGITPDVVEITILPVDTATPDSD